MGFAVSWHSVALHLADRGGACALLDRASTIHLFNAGLERLLGWRREEVEGQPWSAAIAPPEDAPHVASRIERALSGTLRTFESLATTRDGKRMRLTLEAALVGRDAEQGVLLTVSAAVEAEPNLPHTADEMDYEISARVSDFGRLTRLEMKGRVVPLEGDPDTRCYARLRGRTAPCSECPALRPASESWPRTVARRLRGTDHGYEVIHATAAEERVRVRLRKISEESIGAIYDSRIRDLADTAQLSERERAVLTYLLMGRSLADIATILNISPRTVKFHQANLLEKLGADSRADLIRLIT